MPVSYFTFSAPAWPSPSANQIYLLKWQPSFVFSSNKNHSSSSHGRGQCLIFTMTMALSSSALGAGSGVLPWHVIWEWERGKFHLPKRSMVTVSAPQLPLEFTLPHVNLWTMNVLNTILKKYLCVRGFVCIYIGIHTWSLWSLEEGLQSSGTWATEMPRGC